MRKSPLLFFLLISSLLLSCKEDDDVILVHGTVTKESDGSAAGNIRIKVTGNELMGGLWPTNEERYSTSANTNTKGEFRVELPGDKNIEEVVLDLRTSSGAIIDVISGCPLFCEFEAKSNMQINLVISL